MISEAEDREGRDDKNPCELRINGRESGAAMRALGFMMANNLLFSICFSFFHGETTLLHAGKQIMPPAVFVELFRFESAHFFCHMLRMFFEVSYIAALVVFSRGCHVIYHELYRYSATDLSPLTMRINRYTRCIVRLPFSSVTAFLPLEWAFFRAAYQ